MRATLAALGLAVAVAVALGTFGCGGRSASGPVRAPSGSEYPSWADALPERIGLLVLVRPNALRHDPTYGPLLGVLMQLATARSDTGGTRVLEVLSHADEVVFVWSAGRDASLVLVARGVRADHDPSQLVDEQGTPLFRRSADQLGFVEYASNVGSEATAEERAMRSLTALFVLRERTWVLAMGDLGRVRSSLSDVSRRAPPPLDAQALVLVAADGPALVSHVPRLRRRGAPLAPLGTALVRATLALSPKGQGIVATLSYAEEPAAERSLRLLERLRDALAHERESRVAWLDEAQLFRHGRDVLGRVPLPEAFVRELAHATLSDFASDEAEGAPLSPTSPEDAAPKRGD